jgi:hypothetical protein
MSAVVKAAKASYDAESARKCVYISGLFSGDKFSTLDPVYITNAGRLQAANDDSDQVNFDGFASVGCDSLAYHPVTLLGQGVIMNWLEDSDAMVPGTLLYVGAAGELETTGRVPVAMAINTQEIIVICPPGIRRLKDSVALVK